MERKEEANRPRGLIEATSVSKNFDAREGRSMVQEKSDRGPREAVG
jgi:hypothetical protein